MLAFSQDGTPLNSSLYIETLISSIYTKIICIFRDIWQNLLRTPNMSEASFHPFNTDDCRLKKKKEKYMWNIFSKITFISNFIKIGNRRFDMLSRATY